MSLEKHLQIQRMPSLSMARLPTTLYISISHKTKVRIGMAQSSSLKWKECNVQQKLKIEFKMSIVWCCVFSNVLHNMELCNLAKAIFEMHKDGIHWIHSNKWKVKMATVDYLGWSNGKREMQEGKRKTVWSMIAYSCYIHNSSDDI